MKLNKPNEKMITFMNRLFYILSEPFTEEEFVNGLRSFDDRKYHKNDLAKRLHCKTQKLNEYLKLLEEYKYITIENKRGINGYIKIKII